MPEQQELPSFQIIVEGLQNAPLKMVFIFHFILITWGIQGIWSPDSYLFYNLLFFLTLLWCMHSKDAEEPPMMAFIIDLVAILFDVIVLSVYFPRYNYSSSERFSVGMAILNLVVRPLSCLVLHKVWKDRQIPTLISGNRAQPSRSYQDIEAPKQSFPGSEDHPPYH